MANSLLPSSAFTLIELLVVIAIISLLVSILLPSLQQAKELALAVSCAENTRNTSTAMAIYMNDYDDTFPACFETLPDGSGWDVYETATWQQKLLDYAGNNPYLMLCSRFNGDELVKNDPDHYSPSGEKYRNGLYLFMAPKDYPKIGYNHRSFSCGAEYIVGFSCLHVPVYRKSSDIKNLAGMVELMDSMYLFGTFRLERHWQFHDFYASFPHINGDSNYGFADGHVERVPEDSPLHYDPVSWTGGED